jgi:DNA-binding MarR family transcriptional regulator
MKSDRSRGKGARARRSVQPSPTSPQPKIETLDALFNATVSLFHTLTAAAEHLHQQGNFTAGKRGVLRGLYRLGPQTVPQMARARPVSRQYIQMLTDRLAEEGLVEFVDNPAHKRSWLVRLTEKGKTCIETMLTREARLFKDLPIPVSEEDILAATAVLRSFREVLQSQAWRDAVERVRPLTQEDTR